jgi:hypothetical protein
MALHDTATPFLSCHNCRQIRLANESNHLMFLVLCLQGKRGQGFKMLIMLFQRSMAIVCVINLNNKDKVEIDN